MKKILKTLILFFAIFIGFFTICNVITYAEEEATEEQAIYICHFEEDETLYVILNGEKALLSMDNETWYETTYKKIDNYLYIYNFENEGEALLFAINEDKTLTPIDHIVPNETPEEEQLGFFEENWKTIISALLGTASGVSLLCAAVGFLIKKLTKATEDAKKKAEENGSNTEVLNGLAKGLQQAQQDLVIAYNKIEELTVKLQNNNEQFKTNLLNNINAFKNEIITNYGDKVILMDEHYKDILNILDLIANNSEDIVKAGASRLISEMVEEAKKEVAKDGEKEELQG